MLLVVVLVNCIKSVRELVHAFTGGADTPGERHFPGVEGNVNMRCAHGRTMCTLWVTPVV